MQVPVRRLLLIVVVLAIAFCGQAGDAASQPTSLQTITMGVGGWTANEWPQFVSDELGFFAAHDVKLNLLSAGDPGAVGLQIISGALDIAGMPPPVMIQAIEGGAPIISFAAHSTKPPYLVLARKGISSIGELRGKTIIVASPTDMTRIFMDKVMAANNLKPDDYSYAYAPPSNNRFAALMGGAVDAAILAAPFSFRASSQGYPVVADVSKYYPSFLWDVFVVRKDWAAAHSDLLVDFIKGYLEGVRWLYNPANKAQAVSILSKRINVSLADASATYDLYVSRLHEYAPTGIISNSDLAPVIDALVKTGQLKSAPDPTQLYDNRWARAAQIR